MARIFKNNAGFLYSTRSILFRSTSTRSIETLAFEEVRAPSHSHKPIANYSAFVLHGLTGSSRNWRSFSRNLASSLSAFSPPSDWEMVLVDLRNHGRSAGLYPPPHDIVSAANDVANLVKSQSWSWPDVVIGHSMGGKVALQYAMSCARGDYGTSAKLPKQLWVLDSVPGIVNPEETRTEVDKALKTLQGMPKTFPSRKWLVDHLTNLGFSKSWCEWLSINLKKSGEHETLAFDLEAIIQMFDSYREMDYWPLLENPPEGMEIVIVRAENSEWWDPHVKERLESLGDKSGGKVSVVVLPKSGHWVHVDNPKGLLEIVIPKIASFV